MSEPLTRGEFEDCISSTSNYKRSLVLAHDAAQRAQIEAQRAQLEKISQGLNPIHVLTEGMAMVIERDQRIDELTRERNRAQGEAFERYSNEKAQQRRIEELEQERDKWKTRWERIGVVINHMGST